MGIPGTIGRKLGPVTYQVDTGSGIIVKHHIDQLTQHLEPQPVDIETPENPTVEDAVKNNFQYSNLVEQPGQEPVAEIANLSGIGIVRPLPEVRRRGAASPLTSYVTKRGHTVVVLSYHKVRGGATITRLRSLEPARSRRTWLGRGDCGWVTTELHLYNYVYRARPGPGLRRTAVATAAERLPVCTCRARQTACWMSRQI